jgi:hypothetical protein
MLPFGALYFGLASLLGVDEVRDRGAPRHGALRRESRMRRPGTAATG